MIDRLLFDSIVLIFVLILNISLLLCFWIFVMVGRILWVCVRVVNDISNSVVDIKCDNDILSRLIRISDMCIFVFVLLVVVVLVFVYEFWIELFDFEFDSRVVVYFVNG